MFVHEKYYIEFCAIILISCNSDELHYHNTYIHYIYNMRLFYFFISFENTLRVSQLIINYILDANELKSF